MIHPNASPWIERFMPLLDREEIKRRAARPGSPLLGLVDMPTEVACQQLHSALEQVFVPTEQCCDVLLRFVELAMAHSVSLYPSTQHYIAARYSSSLRPITIRPICFTGVAGVGKSHLLQALHRVLPPDKDVWLDPSHPQIPMAAHWSINVRANTRLREMILPLLRTGSLYSSPPTRNKDIILEAQREAFQAGVSLLTADEFQFATQSKTANTLVTQLLLSLTYINVPMVYAANFSLCHRLMRRPHEDRQRLLADPIVLEPDGPTSADWEAVLQEYKKIAPDILRFDPNTDRELLHRYTAGVRRLAAKLLQIAYRRSRQAGRQTVGRADIEGAYLSPEYTASRQDVDLVQQQVITGRMAREDLWCPFDLPKDRQTSYADSIARTRSKTVAREMLKSSMTAEERKAFRDLTSAQDSTNRHSAKVVKMPRQKVSAHELIENARAFREQQDEE